jgi:hypothetical protein
MKYNVIKRCFIGGSVREVGEVIEFDGIPGKALEPADQSAMADKSDVKSDATPGKPGKAQKPGLGGQAPQGRPDLLAPPKANTPGQAPDKKTVSDTDVI